MRAVVVVVRDVFVQNGFEVPASDDEYPVQAFSPEGTDESFRVRVGLWRLDRCLDDPHALGVEDFVEGSGELGVAVTDQESSTRELFPGSEEQVAGLLGGP